MATTYEQSNKASSADVKISKPIVLPVNTDSMVKERIAYFETLFGKITYQSAIETTPDITSGNEVVIKQPDAPTVGNVATKVVYDDTATIAPISVDSIFNRDYLLPLTGYWTTSDTRFVKVSSLRLPADFLRFSEIAPRGVVRYHALYKSNFKFTMRADSTNYHAGILIAFAIPGEETPYDKFSNLNYATVMNYPHVFLNVGLQNEVSFDIPFGHIFNMTPCTHYEDYTSATIYVMVWSPLLSGSNASTSIALSYWLRPINTYVSVKTTTITLQGFASVVKPIAHAILDNFDIPYSHYIKGVGKVFGLYDRTLYEDENPESARPCDMRILAINTRFNQLEVIPNMQYRYDYKMHHDLMDFARIPALAQVISWSTSQPAGTILSPVIVSPSTPMLYAGIEGADTNTYYATNFAGVASWFQYYRGDVECEIVIVASSFHRGNLFIAYDPYGSTTPTIEALCGLPGVSIAVGSSSNSLRVRLPYSKHKDYVNVKFPLPPTDDEIGTLYLIVQNGLSAPVGVSTTIEILLYMNAGANGEFKYPLPKDERVAISQGGIAYQGELTEFYDQKPVEAGFIMGDHTNVLNIMRRPDYIGTFVQAINANVSVNVSGGRLPHLGIHRAVAQLFKYSSGGIIVHFITNVTRAQGCLAAFRFQPNAIPDLYGTTNVGAFPSYVDVWQGAAHNITRDPCVNFLVPGYNEVPFFYNVLPSDTYRTQTWKVAFNYELPSGTYSAWVSTGHSVADDFSFYCPLSMYKLAIKIKAEEEGGVVPQFSSAQPVDGFSIVGTNFTDPWKAFDRDLATKAIILTQTTGGTIRVNFPSSNTYVIQRFFMSASGGKSGSVVLAGNVGAASTTLFTANTMDDALGYHTVSSTNWYDYYTFTFSGLNPLDPLIVFEMQLYAAPYLPLVPVMTSNTTPPPYNVIGQNSYPDNPAYYAFDGVSTTSWRTTSATARVSVDFPAATRVRQVVVYPMVGYAGDGFTEWTIVGDGTVYYTSKPSESLASVPAGTYFTVQFRTNVAAANWGLQGKTFNGSGGTASLQFYDNGASFQMDNTISYQMLESASSIYSQLTKGLSDMRSAFRSLQMIGGAATSLDKIINKIPRFLQEIIHVLTCISNGICAVNAIITGGATLRVCGLVSVAAAIVSLTSAVEPNEAHLQSDDTEVIFQSEQDYESFIERCKKNCPEVLVEIKDHLRPTSIFRYVCSIFKKAGMNIQQFKVLFERQKVDNPDSNSIALIFESAMHFFVSGEEYHVASDVAFSNDIAEYQNDLAYYYEHLPIHKCTFRGVEATGVEHLLRIEKDIERLRKRAAYVRRRSEMTVRNLEILLEKIKTRMRKDDTQRARGEAVSLYFFGEPGVGKTVVAMHALPLVMNHLLKDDPKYKKLFVDFSNKKYSEFSPYLVHTMITSEHAKFDSLYKNQPFIILDDAFTERTSLDAAMATRLVNAAPLEVLKADIADKGGVYNSPFVFFTSNEKDPVRRADEHINSGFKLVRRLGKQIEVTLKDNNRKFNADDIFCDANATPNERIDAYIYYCDQIFVFTEYWYPNNTNGVAAKQHLTFRQIVDHLRSEFQRKNNFISDKLDFIAGRDVLLQGDEDEEDRNDINFWYDLFDIRTRFDSISLDGFDDAVLVQYVTVTKSEGFFNNTAILDILEKRLYVNRRLVSQLLQIPFKEREIRDWLINKHYAPSKFVVNWAKEHYPDYHAGAFTVDYCCSKLERMPVDVFLKEDMLISDMRTAIMCNPEVAKVLDANVDIDPFVKAFFLHMPGIEPPAMYQEEEIMEHLEHTDVHTLKTRLKTVWKDAKHFFKFSKRFQEKFRRNERIDPAVKQMMESPLLQQPKWYGLIKEINRVCTVNNLKYCAAAGIALAGAVAFISGCIRRLGAQVGSCFQSLVYDNRALKEDVKHMPIHNIIPQINMNKQDSEIVAKIRKNIVEIGWYNSAETRKGRMHALFLNSNTILVNKHFFSNEREMFESGFCIHIQQKSLGLTSLRREVVSIPRDQREFLRDDQDLVVCRLAVNWPNICNINQFLSTNSYSNRHAVLLGLTPDDDFDLEWTGIVNTYPVGDESVTGAIVSFRQGVTVRGDCGRPYYIPGVGIVGMHSAIVDTGCAGVATLVPKVMVTDTPYRVAKMTAKEVQSPHWHSETPLMANLQLDGITLERPVMRNTSLVKIDPPLVLDDECDYVPTRKRVCVVDGVSVDPMLKNSQKWETFKVEAVPLRYIEYFTGYLSSKIPSINARPLNEFETINGYGRMTQINMKTSPGIWSDFFKTGKKEIFSPLPQEEIDGVLQPVMYEFSELARTKILGNYGQTFVDIIRAKEKQMISYEVPPFPFVCTMKDELKSFEKFLQAKVRVFEQSSLDLVYLCRKYFGHFIDTFKSMAGFGLYHGIGNDVDTVWRQYAEQLQANSVYGHAFDYKNFDGSLPKECYTFFKLVTDEYYGDNPEWKAVRHCIIDTLQNSIHIVGSFAFESTQGNKSGNAFTDVFNSISNIFLVWETFIAFQIKNKRMINLTEFDRNVKMLTYGDDVVMTVKLHLLHEGYNAEFMQTVLRQLGVTITSASKEAQIPLFVHFDELTYLKRPFKYDKEFQIWRAPLPITDILKELKYRPKKAIQNFDDMQQRIHNVQRFLAHWDRETFEYWTETLRSRCLADDAQHFNASYNFLSLELKSKQYAS